MAEIYVPAVVQVYTAAVYIGGFGGGGKGPCSHKTPEVALCPVELSNVALIMAPQKCTKICKI